ncbi:MAG: azurin [Pseudomonadota bacterium]
MRDFIGRFSVVALTAVLVVGCGSDDSGSSKSAADKVADAAKDAADSAASAAGDAMDSAKEKAGDAMDSAKEKADNAMDAAKDMANDAADSAKAAVADLTGIGDDCKLSMDVGDIAQYSKTSMSVPSSCTTVAMTLNHTGKLPKVAMGHNWVLIEEGNLDAVVSDGASAGVAGNYVKAGDSRVIAATKLLAGGESDTVTFDLSALESGKNYVYVCTFPGHWAIMKGTLSVS